MDKILSLNNNGQSAAKTNISNILPQYYLYERRNIIVDENEMYKIIMYNGKETNYFITEYGRVFNITTMQELIPEITDFGYKRVTLHLGHRKHCYREFIHKLVALHFQEFIGKKKDYQTQVNHINGCKLDNHYQNLEFCDQSENNIHAYETGLAKRGELDSKSIYTENIIKEICELLQDGKGPVEIANILNIYERGTTEYKRLTSTISKIRQRKNWAWMSREYDF